jgi:hypothetical protein
MNKDEVLNYDSAVQKKCKHLVVAENESAEFAKMKGLRS